MIMGDYDKGVATHLPVRRFEDDAMDVAGPQKSMVSWTYPLLARKTWR